MRSAVGLILLGTLATVRGADEAKTAGSLRFPSPAGKFAMRIVHDAEFAEAAEIPTTAIRSIGLVRLPGEEPAGELMSAEDAQWNFSELKLLWSADGQWCAFSYSLPRFAYTLVFRREGARFRCLAKEDELSAPVKGGIRNQYVTPVRWVKPGELRLRHETIFTGGKGEGEGGEFTATYDTKARKFRIRRVKER